MLYNNFIEEFIGFQEVIVKNIEQREKTTIIYVDLKLTEQHCPCCFKGTRIVHDYREQVIKDIPALGKNILVVLRKRRYRCSCGKRFYPPLNFLPRYHRMTNRLPAYVINKLSEVCSFTSVAREVNLSVSTVIRIFDLVSYSPSNLPEVISIDEFKGNTGQDKYQCIITDPVNKQIIDILETRYKHNLSSYFKNFDRTKTNYFISDMWQTYADIADVFFRKAIYVVDKYHYIRQVVWAFEAVRKEVQKKFNKQHRIYFKRSKRLLTKRFDYLTDDEKRQVLVMLDTDATLSDAYYLKEQFYKLLRAENSNEARKMLEIWIRHAKDSGIKKFIDCGNTFTTWSKPILNSFDCSYTNGFTEGCNNKIKVLKRNAYGYRNFERFRNRILHIFNKQNLCKKVVAA